MSQRGIDSQNRDRFSIATASGMTSKVTQLATIQRTDYPRFIDWPDLQAIDKYGS